MICGREGEIEYERSAGERTFYRKKAVELLKKQIQKFLMEENTQFQIAWKESAFRIIDKRSSYTLEVRVLQRLFHVTADCVIYNKHSPYFSGSIVAFLYIFPVKKAKSLENSTLFHIRCM